MERLTQQDQINRQAAEDIEDVLNKLYGMLPDKVRAYGAAHNIQGPVMAALLEQYQAHGVDVVGRKDMEPLYIIPRALIDDGHLARITRVVDRICRVVSNPVADVHGESPWLDMAGDAVAGEAMRKPQAEAALRRSYADGERMSFGHKERYSDLLVPRPLTPRAMEDAAVERVRSSAFATGPAPCPRCASREWRWMNSPLGVCSECNKEATPAALNDTRTQHRPTMMGVGNDDPLDQGGY